MQSMQRLLRLQQGNAILYQPFRLRLRRLLAIFLTILIKEGGGRALVERAAPAAQSHYTSKSPFGKRFGVSHAARKTLGRLSFAYLRPSRATPLRLSYECPHPFEVRKDAFGGG
jgi:hypothetical protein